VFLLLLSCLAPAQEPATPRSAKEATSLSRRAASLSGVVSDDGSLFVADPDAVIWNVLNPAALRAYVGERVALQAQTAPATGELRVLSIKPREAEPRPVAKLGDAAFRR